MKIEGKKIAEEIIQDLKTQVEKLNKKPHLYIITFGNDKNTQSYLNQKQIRAKQIGAKITIKRFTKSISEKSILNLVDKLNIDKKINGIIIQRPLPKNFNEDKIANSIIREKDVDGFNSKSLFKTPVALAVIKLIENTLETQDIFEYLSNKKIVLIGKGITAGMPIINLFKQLKIKTTILDSKSKNPNNTLKTADIIISSVGKKIITADNIKQNCLLIGVGIHFENGKIKGDYDESEIENIASFYSPTPGGIGPVNVTLLMKNLVDAFKLQI